MANYRELNNFLQRRPNTRILILDNNNIQFCCHHEKYFPVEDIYAPYDLVLIPQWVHDEVADSEQRLMYLARLPKDYFILDEEKDYLPLVGYEDARLIKLFEWASSPFTKPRKFFKEIREIIGRTKDIPDNWIADFYNRGFDTRESKNGRLLKKNAGEISILVLSFLLIHRYYPRQVNHVTIGSSDMGTYEIKRKILEYASRHQLLQVPPDTPISFLSTDVLLVEAIKHGRVKPEEILGLRPNPRSVIYSQTLPDGTTRLLEHVLSTSEFIKMLNNINNYHFIF